MAAQTIAFPRIALLLSVLRSFRPLDCVAKRSSTSLSRTIIPLKRRQLGREVEMLPVSTLHLPRCLITARYPEHKNNLYFFCTRIPWFTVVLRSRLPVRLLRSFAGLRSHVVYSSFPAQIASMVPQPVIVPRH